MGAVTGKGGANLAAFNALVDAMRENTRGLTLREIIEHVIEASGLADHYRNEKEGRERLENLDELVNAAEAFVTQEGFGKDAVALPVDGQGRGRRPGAGRAGRRRSPRADARGEGDPDAETGEIVSPLATPYLTHAALEAGGASQAQAGQDAIQLMTVHAAKGLEFDCVFITGLEEGLFPRELAVRLRRPGRRSAGPVCVAITRARSGCT